MVKLKSNSVNLNNVHPKIYEAIGKVAYIYASYGSDLVITSARDSKHGGNSLHYVGKAFDIRVWNIDTDLIKLTGFIASELGNEYDVVFEVNHIHIEYDPE